MSDDYTLIMENWRNFVNEINPTFGTGHTPPETVAVATSNKEKLQQYELLMKFQGATPELRQLLSDISAFMDTEAWGTFAAYFNATLGWVLPELPRDGSREQIDAFAVEIVIFFLFFMFGAAVMKPFVKFGKMVWRILMAALKRNKYALAMAATLGTKGLFEFCLWAAEKLQSKWESEFSFRDKKISAQMVQSVVTKMSNDIAGEAQTYMTEVMGLKWCKSKEFPDKEAWSVPENCLSAP